MRKSGDDFETRVLGKAEFEKELKRKLVEESKEVAGAPKEELLNELADVLELTKSIASHHKIPFSKVEQFQEERRKNGNGGRYTRSYKPVKLVYKEELANKSEALKREAQLKKLTRVEKEGLINN